MTRQPDVIERPGQGPADSWSRSLAPATRASRRRWVVALAAVIVGGGVCTVFGVGSDANSLGAISFLASYSVLGVGVQAATRNVTVPWRRDLDDRDRRARGEAYVVSLPLLTVILPASVLALYLGRPDARLTVTDVVAFAVWCFVLASLLPAAVLAWTEPDVPEPEPAEGLVRRAWGEPARDLLVGVAVLLSVGLALAGVGRESGAELLWFVLPFAAGGLLWLLDTRRFQRAGRGLA